MKLLGPGKPAGDKSTALIVIPNPELKLPKWLSPEWYRWLREFNTPCTCPRERAAIYGGFHLRGDKPVCNTCGRPR